MPAKVKPFFECEFAPQRTPFPKSPQLNVLTAPSKPNGGIADARESRARADDGALMRRSTISSMSHGMPNLDRNDKEF
jgi:hypothetical protein